MVKKKSRNKVTSPKIAKIASGQLRKSKIKKVKEVAGSALSQAIRSKKKNKRGNAAGRKTRR